MSLFKFIPVYSKFCGGFNIGQAKQFTKNKDYLPIFDFVREGISNSKGSDDTHQINIKGLESTINSVHAIKISGLQYGNIDKYLEDYNFIARNNNNKILIDAEDFKIQPYIEKITDIAINKYNNDNIIFYKTYQMYRIDSLNNLKKDLDIFEDKLAIKLVRGAYLNQDKKYNILFNNINDTHQSYNNAVDIISGLNNNVIVATHNDSSCKLILDKLSFNDNFNPNISFAQLLGMNDDLTNFLLNKNQKVYKYIPYGPFHQSIPYLLRRLYENYDMLKYI